MRNKQGSRKKNQSRNLFVSGLRLIARFFVGVIWCILTVLLDLAGLIFRLFAHLADGISKIWRRRMQNTASAAAVWHQKSRSRGSALLGMLRVLFFGKNGILRAFLRYAVPVTCCLALPAVVRRTMTQTYAVSVAVDGTDVGLIAEESDYYKAQDIVQKRLAGVETEHPVTFSRQFQIEKYDGTSALLSASELADIMLRQADLTLVDATGVYVNDEFQGAVTDTHPIIAALTRQLSAVSDQYAGEAEEVFFADTITYEAGVYPAENIVDAQKLANKLTVAEHLTRTYTAGTDETVYSVADRFSVTPDEIRKLNPDLPEALPKAARIRVPVVQRYLPVVVKKKAFALSFTDFKTIRTKTAKLPAGREEEVRHGIKGEKESQVFITYTDGVETSRREIASMITVYPTNCEIAVGTFKAQPYSTDTRIDGNGKYIWPVDGGKITDLFGGEREHGGMDIGAAEYSEIYAAADGEVLYSGWEPGYGNFVILKHPDDYMTVYGHCVELHCQAGNHVKCGDVIALVGNTGDSTGAHLHFEVRDPNGVRINPTQFLRVNMD